MQIQLNPATGAVAPALICGRISAAESPSAGLASAGVVATAVSGGSGTFTTLTGPDGSYCIGVPFPSAQYTLAVSQPGRQTSYYLGAGETGIDSYAATRFTVVGGGVTTRDMLLPVGASFSGRVTTGGATPIPAATVIFHRYDSNTFMPTDTTMTDVNGVYSFVGLPPGLYSASGRMPGYAVSCYGGASDLGAAKWFALGPSESRANVDIDLAVPAGTITGQVTALSGGPVANATVYARGGFPRASYVRSTATDASGNYTLPGLAPGRYLVEVRPTVASGYAMRFYAAAVGQDVADPVDVTAGATNSNINIALLGPPGAISGVVRDQAGDPVTAVCVGAELITGGWTRAACANGDGSYTIDRLPAGLYRVRALTEGAHINQYYNGQLVSGAADEVTVTAGLTTPNLDFTLKAHPGQIRGTVTRADNGQPVVGASINVRIAANNYMGGATSSASGAYTVGSLAPGNYKVRVTHPDFALRYYSPTGGAEEMDAGAFVAVTADADTANINIALTPTFGRISGKVTELDGTTPLVGAFIGVRHVVTGRTVAWDVAGTGGTYEVTGIPAGTYTVRASIRGRAGQEYNGKVTLETADPVVVTAGVTTPNVNFALSPVVGSLSGRLTRTDGTTAIGEASIDAYDAATGGYVSGGVVRANGDFVAFDLPPGTYKVKALHAPGFADRYYLAGQPGAPGINTASVVVVTNGADTPGINIQLTQSAFVTGEVTYTGGQTGPVVVQLFDNSGFTGTPIYTITLAGPGAFLFGSFTSPETGGVVPGTYYLRSFLDLNGNGQWDVGETRGVLGGGTPSAVVVSTEGQTVDAGDVALVPLAPDAVGAFRPSDGTFYLDYNGSGTWDGCGVDRCLQIGMNGDIPLVGDWNGTGTSKVGAFRPSDGTFYLDYNGNGVWDGCGTDRCLQIGMFGDIPLVGDWNGTGSSKVGAFRPSDGTFYLDYNGSGNWDGCGVDRCLQIGMLGDIPLIGDWNGNGTSKVGAFRPSDGTFYLDYNGSGTWEGCGTDRCLQIGMTGDIPLVGDWNGSGTSKVGTFRPSDGTFYLDYNGNGQWEGCGVDRCLSIGMDGDIPLVGDWNGNGSSKVGAFRPSDGTFYLDYNGSGTWEGCGTDRCLSIGMNGDEPLVGKW